MGMHVHSRVEKKNPAKNSHRSLTVFKVVCGDISFSFSLDDFYQKRIIEGLDKIDITLGYLDQIENFSQSRKHWKPKLV